MTHVDVNGRTNLRIANRVVNAMVLGSARHCALENNHTKTSRPRATKIVYVVVTVRILCYASLELEESESGITSARTSQTYAKSS
eukprot:8728525-Pyramimonas_sp.AAC.2